MFKQSVQWVKIEIASWLRAPSAEVLALRELEEAKRRLLEAQSGREYAASMCKYHEDRINRLTRFLHNAHSGSAT